MYSFRNDYSEGANPEILKALQETNLIQTPGYGIDEYSEAASDKIKKLVKRPDAQVHFMVGGTIANLTVIASLLKPYEAVIAVSSAHINTHETGAVEASGHKILTVEARDGKLTPALIDRVLSSQSTEHMVKPKLVYISDVTEVGTVYQRQELAALYEYTRLKGLYLFLDGARLAPALVSSGMSLDEIGSLTDVFYIGGTKNGLLFGECLVFVNSALSEDFRYMIKRTGGMLAKGRLLGVMFGALFENDLYLRNAEQANRQAAKVRSILIQNGYELAYDVDANMVFAVFPNEEIATLGKSIEFEVDHAVNETTSVVRFVCSWATTDEGIVSLDAAVRGLHG
jgi:threonine aldolase